MMNNKPEPKFVPGERVRLDSKSSPEFNGEYTVMDARFFDDHINSITRKPLEPSWSYKLNCGDTKGWGWIEPALRKLPPNTPTTFADCIFKPEKVTA